MFDFYENKTTLINILNTKNGLTLKKQYVRENRIDMDKITIRLIYKGFEITNDLVLNKVKFDEISNISVIIRCNTIKEDSKLKLIPKKIITEIIKMEEEEEEEVKIEISDNNEDEVDMGFNNTLMKIEDVKDMKETKDTKAFK
jgi:hypothetical protein